MQGGLKKLIEQILFLAIFIKLHHEITA